MTELTHHPDHLKALDAALEHIKKAYGAGAIMRLDGSTVAEGHPAIPTGSLALDLALGIGGLPRGRMCEIYGPEASGKTTIALHAIAACQAMGGTAAFIDAEHALDATYAAALGVQIEQLLLAQPDNGEQALEICDLLVRSGAVDLVVIDSVAALVPKAEIDGEMADLQVGLQARLISKAMRKLTGCISKSGCTVLFINQLRAKIGVIFGSREVTTGGNALKYYTSVRLDIRRIGGIKKDDIQIGNKTRVRIVKNKMAPPFRQVEFELRFGEGVSRELELLDLAEAQGLVEKRGSYYSFGDEKLGQGREAVRAKLKEQPELTDRLEQLVRAAHGLVPAVAVAEA
jgi:recombination protein RecA